MEKLHTQVRNYILYERRITIEAAAEQMPISRVHLTNFLNGHFERGGLGKKAAVAIAEFSCGKYKASELMGVE